MTVTEKGEKLNTCVRLLLRFGLVLRDLLRLLLC
jgi:hypothetical protein